MEQTSENIHNFQLYVRTSPDSGSTMGYSFVHEGPNRDLHQFPQYDFYLPVFLTKTGNISEYVEITHDDTIFTMERQEVNPFYIEFAFFDSIKRNKVNEGADLSAIIMNFIRAARPDVANLIDVDLKKWFDNIGIYEMPWDKGTASEINLDTLDKISLIRENIISKAFFNKIDINK